jgi:hypothetical protein
MPPYWRNAPRGVCYTARSAILTRVEFRNTEKSPGGRIQTGAPGILIQCPRLEKAAEQLVNQIRYEGLDKFQKSGYKLIDNTTEIHYTFSYFLFCVYVPRVLSRFSRHYRPMPDLLHARCRNPARLIQCCRCRSLRSGFMADAKQESD